VVAAAAAWPSKAIPHTTSSAPGHDAKATSEFTCVFVLLVLWVYPVSSRDTEPGSVGVPNKGNTGFVGRPATAGCGTVVDDMFAGKSTPQVVITSFTAPPGAGPAFTYVVQ